MKRLLRTHTGKMIDPFEPNVDDICIEDIAFALSNISRYGGHTELSVAQHCCMMAEFFLNDVSLIPGGANMELAYEALMHDSPEYLLGDIPAPIKKAPEFSFYAQLEEIVGSQIAAKFGFSWPTPPDVKVADVRMRFAEQRDLMKRAPKREDEYPPLAMTVKVWPREEAEGIFLELFRLLRPDGAKRDCEGYADVERGYVDTVHTCMGVRA